MAESTRQAGRKLQERTWRNSVDLFSTTAQLAQSEIAGKRSSQFAAFESLFIAA
jgi:hypothetical protein